MTPEAQWFTPRCRPLITPTLAAALLTAPQLFVMRTTNNCRSEEHTSELQSQSNLVCRLLLETIGLEFSLDMCPPAAVPEAPRPRRSGCRSGCHARDRLPRSLRPSLDQQARPCACTCCSSRRT